MCELQDQIKDKIITDKELLAYNLKWENYNSSKLGNNNLNVKITERKNINCTDTIAHYKYIEYTRWSDKKLCAAIGFNPAKHKPDDIDGTNIKLINTLGKKGYGGYLLLNLYPQVSPNKEEFDELNKENIKFHNTLLKVLDVLIKENIDTVIFWGRTVSIDNNIFSKLEEMRKQRILYMTVKEGTSQHCHPARVSIDIKLIEDSKYFDISPKLIGEKP